MNNKDKIAINMVLSTDDPQHGDIAKMLIEGVYVDGENFIKLKGKTLVKYALRSFLKKQDEGALGESSTSPKRAYTKAQPKVQTQDEPMKTNDINHGLKKMGLADFLNGKKS